MSDKTGPAPLLGKRKTAIKPPGFYTAEKLSKPSTPIVETLKDRGYEAFWADERTHSNGAQQCQAKLHYRTRESDRWKERTEVTSGAGHSEVQAVDEFVRTKCNYDVAVYSTYQVAGIRVQCEQKSVCVRCAVFLGLLGIQNLSAATTKSPTTMDMTEWTLPPNLRDFFRNYVAETQTDIAAKVTKDVILQLIGYKYS
jgi:hypothetical protein